MITRSVGEFINHLAKKAGIPEDNKALISVLSSADLTKFPIAEDLFAKFDESLLGIGEDPSKSKAAKATFIAKSLQGWDNYMLAVVEGLDISDEERQAFKAIRSTYQRMDEMFRLLSKNGSGDEQEQPLSQDEMLQQIEYLKAAISTSQQELASKETQYKEQMDQYKIEATLRSIISKYAAKNALDTLPQSVRDEALYKMIADELKVKELTVKFDAEGELRTLDRYGYSSESFERMIDRFLASKQLLIVNDPINSKPPTGAVIAVDDIYQNSIPHSIARANQNAIDHLERLN